MKVHRHTPSGGKQRVGLGWFKPGAWLGTLSHGHDLRLFMGGFLAFLVVGYFLAALLLFPAPFFAEASTVPDVIGMSQSDAQEALLAEGLLAGDAETLSHPTASSGSVVWQDPPSGVVVPEGWSVQLSVSQGPQQIPVPDVANYTGELARLLIESAGLTAVIESVQTPLPRGEVENTRPRAGVTLRPGNRVRVLVSVGPASVVMPRLLGMTLEQAQDTLEALDLVMGTFYPAISRAQAEGMIFRQLPRGGTLTAPGTNVTGWYVRREQ
ncbi:MAG: PASTA domain-containing protein [Gemmatimonadales bacterium]